MTAHILRMTIIHIYSPSAAWLSRSEPTPQGCLETQSVYCFTDQDTWSFVSSFSRPL